MGHEASSSSIAGSGIDHPKESGSFLKKRTKKLLLCWDMGVMPQTPQDQRNKSLFASFSLEKEVNLFYSKLKADYSPSRS
jgi:hypothetical protein